MFWIDFVCRLLIPDLKKQSYIWIIVWLKILYPLAFFISSLVVFFNTQLVFMLRDKSMFNIEGDKIGQTTMKMLVISMIVSLLIQPCYGYMYDILGRKWILISACFALVVTIYAVPMTSPSLPALCVLFIISFLLRSLEDCNPLLLDYIKSDSRGRASGLRLAGIFIGEIFS